MGGSSSTTSGEGEDREEKARTYVQTTVTRVLNELLVSKAVSVTQSSEIKQGMQNVQIVFPPPGYCPADRPVRELNLNFESSTQGQVAVALETLDPEGAAQAIRAALEDSLLLNANDGGAVVLDDSTFAALRTVISAELTNRTTQTNALGQRMRNIKLPMPCGTATFTIEGASHAVATDIARAVADTLLKSGDAHRFAAGGGGERRAPSSTPPNQTDSGHKVGMARTVGLLLFTFDGGGGNGGGGGCGPGVRSRISSHPPPLSIPLSVERRVNIAAAVFVALRSSTQANKPKRRKHSYTTHRGVV
jgi:hypothetical protein